MTRTLKRANGAFIAIVHAEDSSPSETALVSSLIDGLPGATSFAAMRGPAHMLFEGSGENLRVLDPLSSKEITALVDPVSGTVDLLLAVNTSDYFDSFGGGADGFDEGNELSVLRDAAFAEPNGFVGAAWVTLGPISEDHTAVSATFAFDPDHPDAHQEEA